MALALTVKATPELTHENLASANITNLPSLENNPLLGAYLSDASTGTTAFTCGRRMLCRTIQAQGFSLEDYTHYPLSDDKSFEVATVLWDNLAQSCTESHMVAHHLLAYHGVCPSETVKGRLAYYQDDKKRKAGIRTPIRVRKYLQKFFGEFRSPEFLERLARFLDRMLQDTDEYDIRLYDDSQIGGWADAYYHITSCMSHASELGVGELETWRCYCTAAMTQGKQSSGLALAVLYQDDKPVARTLTYENDDGDKCYVRNYGDDRLVKWLDDNGYKHQQWLPHGTHLWTEAYDDDNDTYLSPYVDGDPDDAEAELARIGGRYYWVISSGGGVVLQNCNGHTSASVLTCECCGDRISDGDEYYRTDMHGNTVALCHGCKRTHCHTVDDEGAIYVDPRDMDNLIATNLQGYYTQEYLDGCDLVVTGDEDVIGLAEAEYCPHSGEYYPESEFTDLSDEPEFVRDTWAGYINANGRVRDWLLHRYGAYIDELDCRVHDDHVSAVMARLESEADADEADADEADAE